DHGRGRYRGEHDRRARQLAEQVQDLGGGTGPGDRQDPVVPAVHRVLGGGESVGPAVPGALAQRGVRLADEPRRAAPDHGHPRARPWQRGTPRGGHRRGPLPARRLAGDLLVDVTHRPPSPRPVAPRAVCRVTPSLCPVAPRAGRAGSAGWLVSSLTPFLSPGPPSDRTLRFAHGPRRSSW